MAAAQPAPRSWRFARTPKWIVRHVAVVLLITGMVLLLLWQVSRLHEKQAYKRLVEGREREAPAAVEDLLPPGAQNGDPEVTGVLSRQVRAEGPYVADRTVIVENRTDVDDTPGGWVLTPLDLGDGRVVLINRGFVALDVEGRVTAPPAPSGRVTITGLLCPSQKRGHFGAKDPSAGVLKVVARVDLVRIAQQTDGELLPAYVQATTSRPAERRPAEGQAEVEALGPPELSEGPHFSYAVQWGIFSTIAGFGYLLLLWKVAGEQGKEAALDAADREADPELV